MGKVEDVGGGGDLVDIHLSEQLLPDHTQSQIVGLRSRVDKKDYAQRFREGSGESFSIQD